MGATTPNLALPYPAGTDPNNVPVDMQALATAVDTAILRWGIWVLTTAQRNALAGADLHDGRLIYNSTTLQYEAYNVASATWIATNGGYVFASIAARDAAITAPVKGMEAMISNIGTVAMTQHDGTAWRTVEVWGTGSPEGVVTATVGAIFHRTDGTAGLVQYSKESGSGNTGWLPIGAAGGADFAFFFGG